MHLTMLLSAQKSGLPPTFCGASYTYELRSHNRAGFHTGFFTGGGEVFVKVVLACVSTATYVSACE